MLRILAPNRYVESIHVIRPDKLARAGLRGVIVDLDNTLTPWRDGSPDEALARWVCGFHARGLKVCIVSNNRMARVKIFGDALGVPVIAAAAKPRRRAFRRAMALMDTVPPETVVIGDQIFTDILGGNRLGLYTILVTPVSRREFIGTQMVRQVERLILRGLANRGLIGGPDPEAADGAGEGGDHDRF